MTSLLVHNTEAFEAKVECVNSGHVQVCSVCVCVRACVRAICYELALVHVKMNDMLRNYMW